MSSNAAVDIPILPNPSLQSSAERLCDKPRLQLLQKLQEIATRNNITNYEDLLEAKKSIEREIGQEKKKRKGAKNDSVGNENKEPVAKKTRKERMKKHSNFPRLVRRNARRGLPVVEGQTWTEEVLLA